MIIFADKDLLLLREGDSFRFPSPGESASLRASAVSEIFHIGDEEVFAVDAGNPLPGEFVRMPLRRSCLHLPEPSYLRAVKGAELLNFDRTHRYCRLCGHPLRRHSEISKLCDSCGEEYFPVLAPAIVVLVERGDRALLVHARNFSRPFYALVAGFVETGESLEECVAREVREETGLEITGIRYFGSQSWPFPSQLMIGFTARWKSGEIEFADDELDSGGWFSRGELPELPSPPSLSRRIIDHWRGK